MLSSIVRLALRFRGIVVALACVLAGYGLFVSFNSPLDVFPDFVPPQATIQTEAPGLSPEQVEALVTRPIEAALGGLPAQESMRSESIQGLSIVTMVFAEGSDLFRSRQMLTERLAELAGTFPAGVSTPKLSPMTSATMDLLKIGLRSTNRSALELRTFADWTLRPRLLAVAGVARCSVFGGDVRQFQVRVRPERLAALGLTVTEVASAVRKATGIRGAGFIETANQRIVVNAEGQAWNLDDLGSSVVRVLPNGIVVRLKDVGELIEGSEPKFGDALVMGEKGVLVTLASQYGANTLDATRAVEAALSELELLFRREGIEVFPALHRPATFIESALTNMQHSLWLGAILVAFVLLLFLGDLRASFISLTAIPLSLLTAILVMKRLGISLNTLTLGGLVIAIGEVVDDAIIDVENILRRLRENAASPNPRSPLEVVFDASIEVRGAVVYATFVVALVFAPILAMSGLQGSFFGPLATSYLLAVFASLGVAMTLTPAMAYMCFRNVSGQHSAPWLQVQFKAVYVALLKPLLRHPFGLGIFAFLLCVGAAACLPFFGGEFLPSFKEGHYVLQVSMTPGTSLTEMGRVGRQISTQLLRIPGIATVEQQIGRAEQGEDPWGPHRSEFHVELKPGKAAQQDAAAEAIRAVLKATPGIQYEVLTFLGDRIGESISGETQPVAISLFGENLAELDATASRLVPLLSSIPGAAEVQMKSPGGSPVLQVQLRSDRLLALGVSRADALDAVQVAYQANPVAHVFRGNESIGVGVVLADDGQASPERVGELLLSTGSGTVVPLKAVSDIALSSARHSILHDGARRRQVVSCNVHGRDLDEFVKELRGTLQSKLELPRGVYLAVGGAAGAADTAEREMLIHSLIAAVGIVALLSLVLRTRANLGLVLANVPFALVGGVMAVALNGWMHHEHPSLNLGSVVGFVTLFGITMRNSIMLISHYEHLVLKEGRSWDASLALIGASERFGPILMTALVTGLGLLPLALGAGEAGREIEGPMAVVILGGLVTSTLLNLLVLPALALRFASFEVNKSA